MGIPTPTITASSYGWVPTLICRDNPHTVYIIVMFKNFVSFSKKGKHLESKEAFTRAGDCGTQYVYGVLTTEYFLTSRS